MAKRAPNPAPHRHRKREAPRPKEAARNRSHQPLSPGGRLRGPTGGGFSGEVQNP